MLNKTIFYLILWLYCCCDFHIITLISNVHMNSIIFSSRIYPQPPPPSISYNSNKNIYIKNVFQHSLKNIHYIFFLSLQSLLPPPYSLNATMFPIMHTHVSDILFFFFFCNKMLNCFFVHYLMCILYPPPHPKKLYPLK